MMESLIMEVHGVIEGGHDMKGGGNDMVSMRFKGVKVDLSGT